MYGTDVYESFMLLFLISEKRNIIKVILELIKKN